jgi:muramoyltetrapeptide carboxypeptidase LdcA involved in peptidoglycan recycling
MNLTIPKQLNPGDKVAIVSLSWGGAGDDHLLWKYNVGKKRLIEEFGLEVVEMPNTLKGTDYLYQHPEKRAQDLILISMSSRIILKYFLDIQIQQ